MTANTQQQSANSRHHREQITQHPLVRRFFRQVVRRSKETRRKMAMAFAIVFRPGNREEHFRNPIRPAGSAVLCLLVRDGSHADLIGHKAVPGPDGSVEYSRSVFHYDLSRTPYRGARGRVLDPFANPTLLETGLRMDKIIERRTVGGDHQLRVVPQFPRIMLGYGEVGRPEFCETPMLRKLAAQRLACPLAQLDQQALVEEYLRMLWNDLWLPPGMGPNNTQHWLIDAEFIADAHKALRVYEDFRELVGVQTWNPVRELLATRRPNPAKAVLAAAGIDCAKDGWREDVILEETMDQMEAAMRKSLGDVEGLFSQSDIYDGLAAPEKELMATATKDDQTVVDVLGPERTCTAMRSMLAPADAACADDEDLLEAAQHPEQGLFLRHQCRIQVLRLQDLPLEEALAFSPEVIGRKVVANLYPARPTVGDVVAKLADGATVAEVAHALQHQRTGPAGDVMPYDPALFGLDASGTELPMAVPSPVIEEVSHVEAEPAGVAG